MTTDQIKTRLLNAYQGCNVDVTDLTGTQDHYKVHIECKQLAAVPRIQAHRAIMDLFQKELHSGEIHAFTISTAIPKEN